MQTQTQSVNDENFTVDEPISDNAPNYENDPFILQTIIDVRLMDSMND